jgi:hypothetical protein
MNLSSVKNRQVSDLFDIGGVVAVFVLPDFGGGAAIFLQNLRCVFPARPEA